MREKDKRNKQLLKINTKPMNRPPRNTDHARVHGKVNKLNERSRNN